MYYPVNNKNNCSIFNKSLFQDLENYDLSLSTPSTNSATSPNLHILYNNESINDTNKVNIDTSKILDPQLTAGYDIGLNTWQPCFIKTDQFVFNKAILDKTTIDNPVFGIDKVISFTPKFKNWTLEENDPANPAKMITNWHINSIYGGSEINYGVLYWYKFTEYGPSSGIKYNDLLNGTKFIIESDLSYNEGTSQLTIPRGTELIKFNNEYIKRLDKNNFIIGSSTDPNSRSNPITFNSEKKLLALSNIVSSDRSYLDSCKLAKDSTFKINNRDIDLFISDGECFSYYYGLSDKLRNNQQDMPSRTYLSPGLSKIYREIYHRLTLHTPKKNSPTLNPKSARLLQKLCYFLSTAPLMDRTTIDVLSDKRIYDAVQTYINNTNNLTDIDSEISKLRDIIRIIYSNYAGLWAGDGSLTKHGLPSYTYKQNLLNNYVNNKRDLFRALTNKYGCSLLISGDTKLKYKNKLKNGSHALINTNTINWRPKSASDTTISYNNASIEIGDISYATDISLTGSVINIKSSEWTSENLQIPLADISLTKNKPAPLYLGSGLYKSSDDTNFNSEIVFDTKDIIQIGDGSTSANVTYFWEQVGGPKCLRFDNSSKDTYGFRRFFNSTVDTPKVYVKQSGTYAVKCTRVNYSHKESDTLVLTTDNQLNLSNISISNTITSYPKIISSNIKSIGFHKKGMVYIIDSDHYVDTDVETDFDDIGINGIIKLKDMKLDLNATKPVNISTTGVDLKLGYNVKNGNSLISLSSISISNMRDETYKYGQCMSFYKEKIKRKRVPVFGYSPAELGSSDFYREIFTEYNLKYHDINGSIDKSSVNLLSPGVSSTKFAPPILGYGGYGSGIVDTIGIRMPGHPEPASGLFINITGLLSNTSNTGQILPILLNRSNILPNNYDVLCHLKEIQPSGSGHYIEFSKGHFHPISGWTNDTVLYGKSNVITYKPELQKSYEFKGVGFSSLNNIPNGTGINIYQSTISLESSNEPLIDVSDVYGYYNMNSNSDFDTNMIIDTHEDDWIYNNSCGNSQNAYILPTGVASKNIRSIDIKLNLLNHANPKNLIIWIDITNNLINFNGTSASGQFLYNSNTASNNEISSYINNLNSNNAGLRLYLLNQQHISNYSHNFTINFTDSADKFIVTDKSLYDNILTATTTLDNNGSILPTLGAVTGVNDLDITKYSMTIRNNYINKNNYYLEKFNGLPINGTNISLNIANIEPIDYDNTNTMDNSINNLLLSDLISVDKKIYSNIINNSLCSWSAIVHTEPLKNNTNSILNYIDYKTPISGYYYPSSGLINSLTNQHLNIINNSAYTPVNNKGYDFIGDFSNRNFLIPLVNINAPYRYLYNINQCFYDDENVTRTKSSLPPELSTLYYSLAIGAGVGMASMGLMGATAGLAYVGAIMSAGGRNDPITNFFINIRASENNAITSSQFYKPIYSSKYYGSPEKTIIAISQDGAKWYNVEVPIFKYSNTPLVHKNVYKYIKCDSSLPESLKSLYQFNFTILKEKSQLELSNVIAKISKNIENKSAEQTIDNIILKENDVIYLDNQTNSSDNGYWIVSKGQWATLPQPSTTPNDLLQFYTYNTIDSVFMSSSISSDTPKNILINGIRPYHFFDIGEKIDFAIPSGTTATIQGKSLISTKSGQKTIITLDTIPNTVLSTTDNQIFKSSTDSNVLFLYKDDYSPTGVYNSFNKDISINTWAIDSKESYRIKYDTLTTRLSCIGEGSIGWGTDQIYPEPLSSLNINDKNNIFNNNDFYINNRLTIIPYSSDGASDGSNNISNIVVTGLNDIEKNRIKARSYSLNDMGFIYNVNNNEQIQYDDNTNINTLFHRINNYSEKNRKNKVILELKSDNFKGFSIKNSGFLMIEDDNLFYKSIKFTNNDITAMNNRLNLLKSSTGTSDNPFNPSSVKNIYDITSISDMIAYYNYLPADSGGCYQPTANRPTNTTLNCKKQQAYKRLQELYNEKHQIQIALSCNNPNISIPHISGSISGSIPDSNTLSQFGTVSSSVPSGISINYKENNDLYWIHLDPDQPCRLNDELTVKILTKGEMIIFPSLIDTPLSTPKNSISSSVQQQNEDPFVGPEHNPSAFINADIGFSKTAYNYNQYIVPDKKISQQKTLLNAKYTNLNWTNDEIFTYGKSSLTNDLSNSKKIIVNDGFYPDYIIQLKETYIRPEGLIRNGKISDVIDLNQNNVKIKFRNLPRKLKSVDSEYFDRYVYDYEGNLVRDLKPPSSVGNLANNFVCWQCFDRTGHYVSGTGVPPYFILANEMRYRAFFGSIDGIEHKNTFVSDSQEDWEWIPFEYYN